MLNKTEIFINSIPDQVMVDLSHPERMSDTKNLVGFLCFATLVLTIIGLISRTDYSGFWECIALLWISLALIGLEYWSRKWSKRPKYFTLYLLSGFTTSITLFYFFTSEYWVKILTAVIGIFFWVIIIIWELAIVLPLFTSGKKLKKHAKLKSTLFVTILIIHVIFGMLLVGRNRGHLNTSSSLTTSASTDPGSPVLLSNGACISENFGSSGTYYYYETFSMSTSHYHLIALHTISPSNNFNLELFSDALYSNKIGSSNSTTQWDWIVYKPSSSGARYPRVHTTTGSGDALIEAERADDFINVGRGRVFLFHEQEVAKLFELFLSSSNTYTLKLTVPAGANFDLYVLRMATGSPIIEDFHASTNPLNGQPERIVFTPSSSADYALIVIRKSGSGQGVLRPQIGEIGSPPLNFGGSNITFFIMASIALSLLFITTLLQKNRWEYKAKRDKKTKRSAYQLFQPQLNIEEYRTYLRTLLTSNDFSIKKVSVLLDSIESKDIFAPLRGLPEYHALLNKIRKPPPSPVCRDCRGTDRCRWCGGNGTIPHGTGVITCQACKGSGRCLSPYHKKYLKTY